MTLKAHKLVIVHDGNAEGSNGFGVPYQATLDGVDLVIPDDCAVEVHADHLSPVTATFTVYADVEFRSTSKASDKSPLVRLWGKFYPFKRRP